MIKLCPYILFLMSCSSLAATLKTDPPARITIFFTGYVQGNYEPCQ